MPKAINHARRRFLGIAAMTIAAGRTALNGSAAAATSKTDVADLPMIKPAMGASFGSMRQIDAGVLNVGYVDVGPTGGTPVVLLHG